VRRDARNWVAVAQALALAEGLRAVADRRVETASTSRALASAMTGLQPPDGRACIAKPLSRAHARSVGYDGHARFSAA
jgi:hypothetical protein